MCKASLWAKHHEIAKEQTIYGIGISDHGLPALHPPGQPATACIACVPDKTVLTLSNVPVGLQKKYGITAVTTVAFVDTGDNAADMLQLIGGKLVPLAEFANQGVSAFVGVMSNVLDDTSVSEAVPSRPEVRHGVLRRLVTARR